MDEKKLIQFVQWLPTKVQELQGAAPEQIVDVINQMGQTPEGQQQLEGLFQMFEQETKSMKKGGKFEYIKSLRNGGCPSCNKRKVIMAREGDLIDSQTQSTKPQSLWDRIFGRNKPMIMERLDPGFEGDSEFTGQRMSQFQKDGSLTQTLTKTYGSGNGAMTERNIKYPFSSVADTTYTVTNQYGTKSFKPSELDPQTRNNFQKAFDANFKKVSRFQNGGSFYRNWSENDIRKLQNFLYAQGYYQGNLDGIVGKQTINAIKQYQQEHGYKADGMWGYNTNKTHRVLDSDILAKGSYTPEYRSEQGDLIAIPTSFNYNKLSDLSNSDAQKVINYYSVNPELLYSDDPQHSYWRQVLHNSGKDGADFLNQIAGSLTSEERARINSKKLTHSYKTDKLVDDTNASRNKFAKKLLPALVAPVAFGAAASALGGGAGLILGGGAVGSVLGSQIGKKIGESIGKDYGERNKDKPYTDPVSERYGVTSSIIDPERRLADSTALGGNVGKLSGGLFGGALGGLATAGFQANAYNTLGLGRAIGGYQGKVNPISPSVYPYAVTTPNPVKGVSTAKLFKDGLRVANIGKGQTRTGGSYGIKFNHNGKTYHAGNYASPEVIAAASERYNNPNSPLTLNFGGSSNTGTGAKIGFGYDVNPIPAAMLGASPTGSILITEDAIADTQPKHSVRQQRREDRRERRAEKRSERERKLIDQVAASEND